MALFPNDYRIEIRMTSELMYGEPCYFWIIIKIDDMGKRCNTGSFGWEPTPEKAFASAYTFYINNFDSEVKNSSNSD